MIPIYIESFLTKGTADLVFNEAEALNWETQRSARKEYFMSTIPREYTYGNKHSGDVTYRSQDFSPLIFDLLNLLNFESHTAYNVCFLNRYNDEKQHLGWHADDFDGMREDQPIAVLSLGAEREIYWKLKDKGDEPAIINKQWLAHGSLWIMPAGFQDKYLHKIPKGDRPCDPRISLTFRSFR